MSPSSKASPSVSSCSSWGRCSSRSRGLPEEGRRGRPGGRGDRPERRGGHRPVRGGRGPPAHPALGEWPGSPAGSSCGPSCSWRAGQPITMEGAAAGAGTCWPASWSIRQPLRLRLDRGSERGRGTPRPRSVHAGPFLRRNGDHHPHHRPGESMGSGSPTPSPAWPGPHLGPPRQWCPSGWRRARAARAGGDVGAAVNAAAVSAAQTEVLTDAAALPADWDALMAGASPSQGRAYLQALAAAPPPGTRYVFAAVCQGRPWWRGPSSRPSRYAPLPWLEAEGALPVRLFLWLTGRLPCGPDTCSSAGTCCTPTPLASSPRRGSTTPLPLHAVAEEVRSHVKRVALTLLKTPDPAPPPASWSPWATSAPTAPSRPCSLPSTPPGGAGRLPRRHAVEVRQRARAARKRPWPVHRGPRPRRGRAARRRAGWPLALVLARGRPAGAHPAETLVALKRGLGEAMREGVAGGRRWWASRPACGRATPSMDPSSR